MGSYILDDLKDVSGRSSVVPWSMSPRLGSKIPNEEAFRNMSLNIESIRMTKLYPNHVSLSGQPSVPSLV